MLQKNKIKYLTYLKVKKGNAVLVHVLCDVNPKKIYVLSKENFNKGHFLPVTTEIIAKEFQNDNHNRRTPEQR